MAERQAIQEKLPGGKKTGYDLIEKKLKANGIIISRQLISKAFTIEDRYRSEVFDAAIAVIKDDADRVESQRNLLATL